MLIDVKLFAAARDMAGTNHLTLEVPVDATVGSLRQALAESAPALAPLLPHCQVAVNSRYAVEHETIDPQAEIALIPPVSGG